MAGLIDTLAARAVGDESPSGVRARLPARFAAPEAAGRAAGPLDAAEPDASPSAVTEEAVERPDVERPDVERPDVDSPPAPHERPPEAERPAADAQGDPHAAEGLTAPGPDERARASRPGERVAAAREPRTRPARVPRAPLEVDARADGARTRSEASQGPMPAAARAEDGRDRAIALPELARETTATAREASALSATGERGAVDPALPSRPNAVAPLSADASSPAPAPARREARDTAPAEPHVVVTIDRVELHAPPAAPPQAPARARVREPGMSLDQYLTLRAGDDR